MLKNNYNFGSSYNIIFFEPYLRLKKGMIVKMNYESMAVSVSDLNLYIKDKIARDEALNAVVVKGEISNFKAHYTGHLYFTLKDDKSIIKCIMFKSYAEKINFKPKDGMKVIVFGSVSVFERDGIYQIYVKAIQEQGIGDLYEAFEKLKNKLEKEGLFNEEHKKKIPIMPKVIGVLSSKTGSVIKDIINVSTRRNPNCYIRLIPVPVQGEGAAKEIVKGIQLINEKNLSDVIILARGGGSLEDLWPFNEEIVARAIYNSKIPIISAVGHETDFTIADFVADLRAPTPSAAAELASPNIFEIKNKINNLNDRLRISLNKKIELLRLKVNNLKNARVLKAPLSNIQNNYQKIDSLIKLMESKVKIKKGESEKIFLKLVSALDALSPLKTLSRGYCIIQKNDKMIKSKEDVNVNDQIKICFIDGEKEAKII